MDEARTPHAEVEAFLDSWARESGGAISFEAWMEAALHHPRFGYYARGVRDVGRRGDFSTAATLHPALARTVASWAMRRAREHFGAWPRRWHLVELGPGSGAMAVEVLRALPTLARMRVVLHLVESAGMLRERQHRVLAPFRGRVAWHATPEDAIAAAGGRALVVSSELADAFPVIAVRYTGERWEELFVARRDGGWREEWRPLDRSRLRGATSSLLAREASLPKGGRGEIGASYRAWMQRWSCRLLEGAMLTLDYGGPADRLDPRRKGGSLRAFFHHQRIEGPELWARFGRQDLTADVNFTDLANWGEELGFETVRLESQREFMLRWLPELEARAAKEPELAYLLSPLGAGEAFFALEQRRRAPV